MFGLTLSWSNNDYKAFAIPSMEEMNGGNILSQS